MCFYFIISFVILFLLYIHYHDKALLNLNLNMTMHIQLILLLMVFKIFLPILDIQFYTILILFVYSVHN